MQVAPARGGYGAAVGAAFDEDDGGASIIGFEEFFCPSAPAPRRRGPPQQPPVGKVMMPLDPETQRRVSGSLLEIYARVCVYASPTPTDD